MTEKDAITFKYSTETLIPQTPSIDEISKQSITLPPLIAKQPQPLNQLKRVEKVKTSGLKKEPNFVMFNAKRNFSYSPRYVASFETTVFNYSVQKKSTTKLQLDALYAKIKKVRYN